MLNPDKLETFFGTLSFMAAALAAHWWYRASMMKLPPHSGDSYEGRGPFSDALAEQSRVNAKAAFTAAFSAAFQALAMASKVILPWFLR